MHDPRQRRLAQPPGAAPDSGEQHDLAPPEADAGALEVLDLLRAHATVLGSYFPDSGMSRILPALPRGMIPGCRGCSSSTTRRRPTLQTVFEAVREGAALSRRSS